MAKTTKNKKEEKPIQVKGFVINIKLTSNDRKGEETVLSLFKSLKSRKVIIPISSDREMAIRRQFTTEVDGVEILYGTFVSAIGLSDQFINIDKMEDETFSVPKYLKANPKEANYVLIPKAHRLFLESGSNNRITLSYAIKFLQEGLDKVIKRDELIEVLAETETSVIDKIFNARKVQWLSFVVSKSNNDTNADAARYVEEQLENMNAGKISTKVEARDIDTGINVKNRFLRGSLNLASSNGHAEARIINENGNAEKIKTDQHPRKFFPVAKSEDSRIIDIYRHILSIFRGAKKNARQ